LHIILPFDLAENPPLFPAVICRRPDGLVGL